MNNPTQYTMPPTRRSPWRWVFFILLTGVVLLAGLWHIASPMAGPVSIRPAERIYPPAPDDFLSSAAPSRPAEISPPAAVRVQREFTPPAAPTALGDFAAPVTPAPSESSAADVLLADLYPSRSSAIAALASRVPDAIAQVAADPGEIHLRVHGSEADARPIANAITQSFPTARLAVLTDLDRGINWSGDGIGVTLTIDEPASEKQKTRPHGKVQVQVAGPSQTRVVATGFANLPWADDFTEFVEQRPPGHAWIVVRTPAPATSLAEASREAEDRAAAALLPLIWQRTGRGAEQSSAIAAAIQREIARNLPVQERFTQRFDRSYGRIWTQSLLLDASPNWLDSMARQHLVLSQQRQMRVKGTAASMAIVLVTIMVAYLFLNAVTKSYFIGRLRTAAIVLALAAVVVAAGVISAA